MFKLDPEKLIGGIDTNRTSTKENERTCISYMNIMTNYRNTRL